MYSAGSLVLLVFSSPALETRIRRQPPISGCGFRLAFLVSCLARYQGALGSGVIIHVVSAVTRIHPNSYNRVHTHSTRVVAVAMPILFTMAILSGHQHCLETVRPGTSSTEPRIGDSL
ncbi:hypothetical protein HDV62DRAFT_107182 [Trichoderma sp. SZMC 28011]